ncbi:MAG: hypothetical protein K2X47_17775 [Bdellovibrionales bacterium]|nr:hypothetical protein [Bdellovibrionales bacterium]
MKCLRIRFKLFLVSFVSLQLLSPLFAWGAEGGIGLLKLNGFLLEPMFRWSDVQANSDGFRLGQVQLGIDWNLNSNVKGILRLGNAYQVGKISGPGEMSSELGVVEAYAEYHLPVGFLRAGLLPIGFGWEGWTRESNLRFNRNQIFQYLWVPVRDLGISYLVSHNRFYSLLTVHNGESDVNSDNRSYFTGTVGYLASAGLNMGVTGMTGRYVLPDLSEERARWVNAFLRWGGTRTYIRLEGTNGDFRKNGSDQLVSNLLSYRVEASQEIGTNWGLQARYDHYNKDTTQQDQLRKQIQYGFFWSNEEETSTLFLIGVKNQRSSIQSESDEVRVIWRVTDQAVKAGEEFTGLVRSEL